MSVDQVQEFALAVKAAFREIERRSNEAMRPLGITVAQAEAILIIGEREPMALKELGEQIIAESGHPSRLVDRMVEAGLVQRRIPPDNRRRVELTLTPRGRELTGPILEVLREVLTWAGGALTGQDLPAALAALHAVLRDSPLAAVIANQRQTPRQ